MKFLQDYLKKYNLDVQEVKEKALNERQAELQAIYELYVKHQKINNWKQYRKLYKEDTKGNQERFVKSSEYYPPMPVKVFAIKLSHMPTQDLYFLESVAKDMLNRGQNFNKWLFYNIKVYENKI